MAQLVRPVEKFPLPTRPLNLRIGSEIDRGAWGAVHEGCLDSQSVAVKRIHELLREAHGGVNVFRSFCGECERLKTLDHPHVIKFLGAYSDDKLGPILVMEKMKENLRQFIENKMKLCIQEQIRISLEITRGVAFLHQLTPPMVHRDLNDKNIMFTVDRVAKIGDFGQSKLKKDMYLTSKVPGMVSFMPPECQREEGNKYDESLDVFSLGVLMLEISTQQLPISHLLGIGVTPEVDRREDDLKKMSKVHPLKPFILLCLSDDPKERPKASDLEMVLPRLEENMLQTMLAAEQRLHTMETSQQQIKEQSLQAVATCESLQRRLSTMQEQEQKIMADVQVAEERSKRTTEEKQSIQMELDRVKALQELSEESDRKVKEENQKLHRQCAELHKCKQKYKNDLQISTERFSASEEEKQSLQKALDHEKSKVANRDAIIWQLQERCYRLNTSVSEIQRQLQSCENELARKRKETQEYGAQYHLAESKRMEAFSQINELTLIAIGMEPQREVDREESIERLRKLYHLVKKQNEAWEETFQCTIREFHHKIEVQETEIMELRTQLAEAEVRSTMALPDKEACKESAKGHIVPTPNELKGNVKLVNGESQGLAGAYAVTVSRRATLQRYRRARCARPDPVQHSKPTAQPASTREKGVARAVDVDEKSKEAALKCDKCRVTFPGDQRRLFWEHRTNNCKPPKRGGTPSQRPHCISNHH